VSRGRGGPANRLQIKKYFFFTFISLKYKQ
jgi:hypothetical protein